MENPWIDEVWRMVDRRRMAAMARRENDLVFATISGAHLYGFASPDSDVDVRGAFLLPTAELIGLGRPRETRTIQETTEDGIEVDFVAHDLRKFARMMIRHNGYVLEQLFSPLVVAGGQAFEALREMGHRCLTRGLHRHYRGFAHSRRKLLRESDRPTVKHLLYAYRVYLTGIRVLRGGGIESNITVLNEAFNLPQIPELVDRKRRADEKTPLEAVEIERHERELDKLEGWLSDAYEKSGLPEEAPARDELNEFIVGLRLSGGR